MLDANDLQAIREIVLESETRIKDWTKQEIQAAKEELRSEIKASEERLREELRSEIKASEERLREELRGEIKASEERVREELRSEIKASEERLREELRSEIKASEERTYSWVEERIREAANLVLEEVDRVQIKLQNEIRKVRNDLAKIEVYYRIQKLEDSITDLILHSTDNIQEELNEVFGRMKNCRMKGCYSA